VALIDQFDLEGFVLVGQNLVGPKGLVAVFQGCEKIAGPALVSARAFNVGEGTFHSFFRPWTMRYDPLVGQLFMTHFKVRAQRGLSALSKRGITPNKDRAYHRFIHEPEWGRDGFAWPWAVSICEGAQDRDDMGVF